MQICNPGSYLLNSLQRLTVTPPGSTAAPTTAPSVSTGTPPDFFWQVLADLLQPNP